MQVEVSCEIAAKVGKQDLDMRRRGVECHLRVLEIERPLVQLEQHLHICLEKPCIVLLCKAEIDVLDRVKRGLKHVQLQVLHELIRYLDSNSSFEVVCARGEGE